MAAEHIETMLQIFEKQEELLSLQTQTDQRREGENTFSYVLNIISQVSGEKR